MNDIAEIFSRALQSPIKKEKKKNTEWIFTDFGFFLGPKT